MKFVWVKQNDSMVTEAQAETELRRLAGKCNEPGSGLNWKQAIAIITGCKFDCDRTACAKRLAKWCNGAPKWSLKTLRKKVDSFGSCPLYDSSYAATSTKQLLKKANSAAKVLTKDGSEEAIRLLKKVVTASEWTEASEELLRGQLVAYDKAVAKFTPESDKGKEHIKKLADCMTNHKNNVIDLAKCVYKLQVQLAKAETAVGGGGGGGGVRLALVAKDVAHLALLDMADVDLSQKDRVKVARAHAAACKGGSCDIADIHHRYKQGVIASVGTSGWDAVRKVGLA